MIAMVLQAFRLAMGAIARNKTRAALTVLGILIGVTAVVVVTRPRAEHVVADRRADRQLRGQRHLRLPAAHAVVGRAQQEHRPPHRERRRSAIAREAVSVSASRRGCSTHGQVVYGDKNVQTEIIGTTLPYYPIRR